MSQLVSTLVVIAGVLLPGHHQAHAQTPPEPMYITALGYSGPSCPAGSAAANIAPDNRAFTVIFDSFVVEQDAGSGHGHVRGGCKIALDLDIPSGWQFQVIRVDARGYISLANRSAKVELKTAIKGHGGLRGGDGRLNVRGPYDGDYQLSATAAGEGGWTKCQRHRDQRHRLDIDTKLKLTRDGLATVDSIDGELQTFALAWRQCEADGHGHGHGRGHDRRR